jgi:SAM-dependent methyltransferase
MGAGGTPGASLRGWRAFFPQAQIFGADIDRRILFQEDRIATFHCDQTSVTSIAQIPETGFDIVIEDGLHEFDANVCFFENFVSRLNSGGIFIIEDICGKTFPMWETQLETWRSRYGDMSFELRRIESVTNHHDNNLIIARRN